ncbi:MAG: homoserine dehydrogenase [Firmicutes bacterium]|nr:homoserine dehydrogenase [Bacillota bacterium]
MKTVGIGILGLGTIGGELVQIILKNQPRIREFYGIDLQIRGIFVRDVTKKRAIDTTGLPLTDNAESIIEDENVQLIMECMGGSGTEHTYPLIKRAIELKKNVVMSSKKVLALHGQELLELSRKNKSVLCYDATVGGGIPIEKVVENSFYYQEIRKIYGILNGTSNFICSNMFLKHKSFKQALKEAQKLGYAENDPSDDIDSYDALYKAEILALMCMERIFDLNAVKPRTIRGISNFDFEMLEEEGYTIKPLVSLEIKGEDLYYIIGPAVVSIEDNVVSGVDANNNIIAVIGSKSGELSFSGQGAGKSPTASVMFDDLLNTLLYRNNFILYNGVKPFREIIEDNTALYLHLKVNDKPGVIADIAGLLSHMGINIDKFITRGKTNGLYDAFVFISNENNIDRDALVKGLKKQHVRILSLIPIVYEEEI